MGKKQGKGVFKWNNNNTMYNGEFYQNYIQGNGCYIWGDGRTYNGTWKHNQMHG